MLEFTYLLKKRKNLLNFLLDDKETFNLDGG